ncbi:hypothetical protein ACWGE0_32075 [Lentzea sp. NPDC054927]
MELKDAMEAATADLDVRPGFVGDVMTGARRRHTRKLLAVTAVVALVAGVTTGVVLTGPSPDQPATGDARLTAATSGDLSGDSEFIEQTLTVWNDARKQGWRSYDKVTDFTAPSNVFWAANTPSGPAALVAQAVRINDQPESHTVVGLVAGGALVQREVDYGQEAGLFRFGPDNSTYVALGLGSEVFWSVNPARGPDLRLTRTWQRAEMGPGGVAVVTAKPSERPVFVRGSSPPAAGDFTREPLRGEFDSRPERAFVPHPGLGWSGQECASDAPSGVTWPGMKPASPQSDLQKAALLDYLVAWDVTGDWSVCAWLPDGRYAMVFEAFGEVYGGIYRQDGAFNAHLIGGPTVKGSPVVLALPDGQGTLVADFEARIGPQERPHAWLAPAGTKEVTVRHGDATKVVQLG